MTRRERMIKQAEMRKKMKNRSHLYKVAPQEEIDKLLNVSLDKERLASLQYRTDRLVLLLTSIALSELPAQCKKVKDVF